MPRHMLATSPHTPHRRELSCWVRPDQALHLQAAAGPPAAGEDPGDMPTGPVVMSGYWAVFNEWTKYFDWEHGWVDLTLKPGCFTKAISETSDRVRCVYEHGYDPQFGMRPIGTITELDQDRTGASGTVELLDWCDLQEYLVPALTAGLLGASFSGEIVAYEVDKGDGKGRPKMSVTEMTLSEFGPCWRGKFASPRLAIAASDTLTSYAEQLVADDEMRQAITAALAATSTSTGNGETPTAAVGTVTPQTLLASLDVDRVLRLLTPA